MITETKENALSNNNFPFATGQMISLNLGIDSVKEILALRMTFVGELGYELYAPFEICEKLVDNLVNNSKGIKVCPII